MRKIMLVLLISVATSLVFAGGGNEAETSNDVMSGAPVVVDADNPSWKIDTSPIELEWFVGYDWASHTFDPENNTFDKYVQEETGVTIKWSSGSLEKLNVLIATNNLPDIVTYNVVSSERLTMENNDLLYPLNQLRDQYAPDFLVVPGMEDWYRNDDGNWYAFSSYFYDVVDTYERGGYLESHNMNFARRDIMAQLGIEEEDLHTKDGLIEALHMVQDAEIEYNGAIMEPWIGTAASYMSEQFGLDREDADGNLMNEMRQSEYLEALLFYNRLFREGLITDEEFTSAENKQLRDQKVSSGHVFAGMPHAFLSGKGPLFRTDNNALMGGIGHLAGDAGKEPIITPSPTGGWTGTMISKNCKTPDRAIQLFAFLSQKESTLAANYGGLDGYDIIDGQAIVTAERKAEEDADPQAFAAKYRTGSMDYFADWVFVQMYAPKEAPDAFYEDLKYYRTTYMDGRFYDDKIFSDVKPDGGSDLAATQAKIDEYWKQQQPRIIMADTEAEAIALYDAAIVQMDSMGMVELDEFKNTRFQENKVKMGVEFAWPRNLQ